MSVLLVTPSWTRDGGVGAHVIASAEALAARGTQVRVLAARVAAEPQPPGITVHHAPRLLHSGLSCAERVHGTSFENLSAIHLHQLDDPPLIEHLRTAAPVLMSVHGFVACASRVHYFRPGQECQRPHGPACVPNLLLRGCAHLRDPRPLPGRYRNAATALTALHRADLAISHSSAVDRHLAINGVDRRALVPLFGTLPHPLPPSVTRAPAAQDPSREPPAEPSRRVLFAGRLVPVKGAEVLVRALAQLDAELVICGEGRSLAATRRLANRLGVAERVAFRGWLEPPALARELARAAVVAIPSLWPEPFGLVGIEALAARRPVVASATGGIPDWLHDGVNGIAVPPGHPPALATALRELLDDPARAHAMALAGERMVHERFSPERHVAALLAAYETARRNWTAARAGAPPPPVSLASDAGAPEPSRA
ncbi:MAG TPA: glycosyltransferase family 4 protein [Solirubrobacteraceae bacterium]|nr:glycosyltransferase family 4 protein [Solirubrobacteraceae bacterium]